ncbi:hypothetical protein [Halpernia sp.]|uniref:hypothetical protein n=1 Tax=Halpernia sp. TaxID=2782209 RepID=UPI003A8DE667
MKTSLKFSILLIIVSIISNAQTWVKTTAPTDLNYSDIRIYGNNIIYALASAKGESLPHTLVSSTDGGQTWTVGTILYNWVYVVATPSGLVVGDILK